MTWKMMFKLQTKSKILTNFNEVWKTRIKNY